MRACGASFSNYVHCRTYIRKKGHGQDQTRRERRSPRGSKDDHVPNTSQNGACVQDPQKLVVGGGIVKVGFFLIHKKGVRHPDHLDVLCPDNQLFKADSTVKGQPWVAPKLSEVHVQGEILEKAGETNVKVLEKGTATRRRRNGEPNGAKRNSNSVWYEKK